MSTFIRVSLSFSFVVLSTLAAPVFAAATSAYTYVVGGENPPYPAALYNDLLTRLNIPLPVNRLLLTVINPAASNGTGSAAALPIDETPEGATITFLQDLDKVQSPPETYALISNPVSAQWSTWAPPGYSFGPTTGACGYLQSEQLPVPASTNNPLAEWDIIHSICWAQYANAYLKSIGAHTQLTGVIYDNADANYQFNHPSDITWLLNVVHASGLKLGWIGGGYQPVDLSAIEVYDRDQNHYTSIDSATPSAIASGNLQGITFPGPQVINTTPGPLDGEGEVSANIYECAAYSRNLNQSTCSGFTAAKIISGTPAAQVLAAFNYIYLGDPAPNPPISPTVFFPADVPATTQIVLLLSMQYLGPIASFPGNGTECVEASGNCSCVGSAYNSKASCGDENGFGAWADNPPMHNLPVKDFTDFLTIFQPLSCGEYSNCELGMYMYDYMPQSWFAGS